MSQTISEPAGRPDSTAPVTAKNFSKFLLQLAGNRLVVAIVIFLIAFGLRAGHNLSLEHRVWYFEDAQNYLRSGASIYRMVKGSNSPSQFFENVKNDAKGYSGIYQAFNSDKLVDRMLTDGAVFPIYLAGVEALSGLDAKNPQYERIALKTSLANSALDSTTCILLFLTGTSLFGLASGALAAVLYAVYPPAIVNTQWCMSESFCTFMLVSTVYCLNQFLRVPPQMVVRRTIAAAATGIVTGLTILARSAFPLFIPFLGTAAIFGTRSRKSLLSPIPLIALVVSLAGTLAPWYLYTQTALGQARLTTNRLPAFNVVSGNLASIDGYTPFPSTVAFPEGMSEAVKMVFSEAKVRPIDFALLQMKKLARLWSSVWNDCKYSVVGIDNSAQTVFHQLLLFLALCWGFIVCARGKRQLTDGELLGTCIAFSLIGAHFVYLAFIALSRYAITAMPFVILAAAAAIVYWWRSGEIPRKKLVLVAAAFVLVSAVTNQFRTFSQVMCALIPEPWWFSIAPWLSTAIAVAAYAGVWFLAVRAISRFTIGRLLSAEIAFAQKKAAETNDSPETTQTPTPRKPNGSLNPGESSADSLELPNTYKSDPSKNKSSLQSNLGTTATLTLAADDSQRMALVMLAAASFIITSCALVGGIIGSRTWSEWSCPLTDQEAHQSLELPAQLGAMSKTGYVIIDLHDEEPLPQLAVELNGQSLNADLFPLQMIQTDNESINESLIMQANSMNMDHRSLRHWYAMPFSTDLLRPGAQNTIAVRNKSKTHPVTIYGDYTPTTTGANDGVQILPSVTSLSWNYAVEGSDYHSPMEARLLESVALFGKTTESSLNSQFRSYQAYKDLSPSSGTQWGRYRFRLLLQPRSAQQLARKAAEEDPITKTGTAESKSETIFEQKPNEEHIVHGGNPPSFYLSKEPVAINEALVAHHPIKFTCELKTEKRPANAFVNLVFKTGIGDVWTPKWQPECIPVDSERWKKVTIIDSFPKNLLEHNGVSVQPIVTPFGKDLLFTHSKKAGKQAVIVRNAKLEILSSEIPQRTNLFTWKVF